MICKTVLAGVLLCWLAVATVGQWHLSDRAFVLAVGGVMVITQYVLQRRVAVLLDVLRLGRMMERRRATQERRAAQVDAPTLDLTLYR